MASLAKRIPLGFISAVISVLIFHQGIWALFHYLEMPGPGMPHPIQWILSRR